MAVEAQRLIALSLGKISQSRQQRGGINLHKNLLVASVLYKARTVFIMENTRPSRSDSEESSSDEETTTVFDRYEKDSSNQGAPVSGTDYQDEPDSPASPELDQVVPECDDMDKENSYPDNDDTEVFDQENENSEYISISGNCKKCHKRRLTDVDSEYTSHASAPDSVASKKPRLELAESQRDNQCSPCEQEQSNGPEAVHITTLVNSFSSGFTGLLNTTDSTSCSPKEGYVSSPPQGQGHSSDSLISCSTQIKEAFETLARPILALTV